MNRAISAAAIFVLLCNVVFATDAQARETERHLLRRPLPLPLLNSQKYIKILSLEGGATRGIISVMSLTELEEAIKEHITVSTPELLPANFQGVTKNDIDVYLADYFDIISGSASGSWIAVYLATKGTDGTLKEQLKDPEIVKKYGLHNPGTASALIPFFYEYIGVFFTPAAPSTIRSLQAVVTNTPGLDEPTYTAEGVRTTMEALVGENTLLDCKTTCLTPMTDIYSGGQITFYSDHFRNDVRTGYSDFSFSNPKKPPRKHRKPHTNFHEGINFRLQDILTCSSSGPVMFPWQNVSSISGPETTLWGGDGYLNIAGFAAFQSLAYAAKRTGVSKAQKYAILSLGTGNGVAPSLKALANLGPMEFAQSAAAFGILLFWGGNDFSNQLDLFYSADPRVGLNQYLRIQTFRQTGTPEGDVLSQMENTDDLPILQKIGEELASNYSVPIHSFVKNYIFGKA